MRQGKTKRSKEQLIQEDLDANGDQNQTAGDLEAAFKKMADPPPDLSGGFKYLKLERMAYYVHKDTYRNAVRAASAALA